MARFVFVVYFTAKQNAEIKNHLYPLYKEFLRIIKKILIKTLIREVLSWVVNVKFKSYK